ncbi:hypothetical protein V8G61_03175 [Gaetbulibacter sp. M240]|uniref:hypothetical protein n=1 Tax=Gaetbulibacter sp. M240 TaxID=3126511 RepID=UPI00374FC9FE
MKTIQRIEDDILNLTNTIGKDYPELYTYLDETPITTPSLKHPRISAEVLEDYLKTLKELLKHHMETHNNK